MHIENLYQSPQQALPLCCDTVRHILMEVNAELWGVEDHEYTTLEIREQRITALWAQLIGHIYATAVRMNMFGHTETTDKLLSILNIIVNADIKDPHIQEVIYAEISMITAYTQ